MSQVLEKIGAQGRNRTTDTRIFRGRLRSPDQWLSHRAFVKVAALAAAVALADPHLLLLTWPDGRQETAPVTSGEICRVAIDAIGAGRWLAEDRPIAMVCVPGYGFAPGSECIENYNCPPRRPR